MSHWRPIYLNKNKLVSQSAFTLVELLIAVAIFSVVSIAIYSTFSSGAGVLKRLKNTDLTKQRILLKVERLSRELRLQPACRKQLFTGEKTKLSFGAIKDSFPYRLTYYFDTPTNAIKRVADKLNEIIDLDGTVDANFHSAAVIFLPRVTDLKFSYLYLDSQKNAYQWVNEWQQDYLPQAVKFVITTEKQKYETTVYLPRN